MPFHCLLLLLFAAPGTEQFTQALIRHYLDKKTLTVGFSGEPSQALTTQMHFVDQLKPSFGPLIGYKAALTNETSQKRFGVNQPILGLILREMLLKGPATIPRGFATFGLLEADLVVRVADPKINQAKTEKEALEAIDAVFPFLELPDLIYHPSVPLDGPGLTAANAGARLGVLGTEVKIDSQSDWMTMLGNIQVELMGERGHVRATGSSVNLMGHPLRVVLWIKNSANARGLQLKAGDLLSLGSITPPFPVAQTRSLTARYTGLIPQKRLNVSITISD